MYNRIYLGAHLAHSANQGTLTVATSNPSTHLNVIFDGNGFKAVTLSPLQAKQLRDALNAAYPADPSHLKPVTPWHGNRAVGKHIVALIEDGTFKPNGTPVVHESLASASREAQRLAKLHEKDFAVLRPVMAAKAEVKIVKTVEVRVIEV